MPKSEALSIKAQWDGEFDLALNALKGAELTTRQSQIEKLAAKGSSLVINSQAGEAEATMIAIELKNVSEVVEKQRKDIVAPFKRFAKEVDAMFSPITDAAERAVKMLRQKVSDWRGAETERLARIEAERQRLYEEQKRKAEEEARRIYEKARKDAEAEAKKNKTELVQPAPVQVAYVPPPAPIEQPMNVTKTKMGSAAIGREVWTYEVINESKIPMTWWMLNEPMLRAAIEAGERNIPGLRIFSKEQVSFRK